MEKYSYLVKLSRPRFWMYIFGPYLLGVNFSDIAAYQDHKVQMWLLISYGVYFLFPANVLIYGVNDFADQDTDQFNPKKDKQEVRFQEQFGTFVKRALWVCFFLGIVPIVVPNMLHTNLEQQRLLIVLLGVFFFCSLGYSLPPLRFKARPWLDGIANILYAVPGFFAVVLTTGQLPTFEIVISSLCWCMAMHAYSAIPDRESDIKASLQTTATVLGKEGTLIYCFVLWSITALLLFHIHLVAGIALSIYPLTILYVFLCKEKYPETLEQVYWVFPYLNGVIGMLLFFIKLLFV